MGMGITVSGTIRMLFDAPTKRSIMYRKSSGHVVSSEKNTKKTGKK